MSTPRKRPSSDSLQIRIRWLFYAFMFMNAVFVFYVYNVASSCTSVPSASHHQLASPQEAKPAADNNNRGASSFKKNKKEDAKDSFSQWLLDNPNTPGARLVSLLNEHLHPHADAEGERLIACHDKNYPLCFGGHAAYHKALEEAPEDKKSDKIYIERETKMPFGPTVDPDQSDGYSVWKMRRFAKMANKFRQIHNLGTEPACLALVLAGAAVGDDFGVVVELGTYLGLSSKCIGLGLNSTKRQDAYFAFDLFGNDDYNYDKITKNMPWTLQVKPDFTKESSYQWLWRNATVDVYPSAQAFEGFINATTVYPKLWKKQPIALMSVDSAKTWSHFRDQTAGIQRPYMLKKGSILILMDFLTIDTQIKLLYTGCMGQYLQPVYSSYCKGEQWIFVATQSFSLGMVGACMQDYLGNEQQEPTEQQYEAMLERAQGHVNFMDNLGSDGLLSTALADERKCMMEHLETELKESTVHWKYLRVQ